MGAALADVVARLGTAHALALDASTARIVAGGSINRSFALAGRAGRVFLKTNEARRSAMFETEASALAALGATGALKVPRVLAVGEAGDTAYLALEWLELTGRSATAEARLGTGLAALHRHTADRFGWQSDNTIGATPQPNPRCEDWLEFWRDARLGPQIELATSRGLGDDLVARLELLTTSLDSVLGGHRPAPSLVHGDLWGGNWSATLTGEPCVFDPAVYYGDREVDMAMTRLFGGFGPAFYAAYEEAWPLPEGAAARAELYNLYHLLNHFNLFGGGYARAIDTSLSQLLRS